MEKGLAPAVRTELAVGSSIGRLLRDLREPEPRDVHHHDGKKHS